MITRGIKLGITVALLGLLLLASVGSAQTTITFMYRYSDEAGESWMQALVDAFEAKYPDIKVDLLYYGGVGGIIPKVVSMVAAGVPPDAAFFDDELLPETAVSGVLTDLTPYIEASSIIKEEFFLPTALESYQWNGRYWGLPVFGSSVVDFYNKDMFAEAGLPFPTSSWTVDEMIEMAKTLTQDKNGDGAADQWGYGMRTVGWPTTTYMQSWLWRFGGSLLNADRTGSNLTDPRSIEGVETYLSLLTEHEASTRDQPHSASAWNSGALGIYPDGSWAIRPNRELNFAWDTVTVSRGPEGSIERVSWDGLVVPTGAKNPREGFLFIEFILSEEGQRIIAERDTWVPARASTANDVWLNLGAPPENLAALIEATVTGRLSEVTPYWNEINATINQHFTPVFQGRESVVNAASKASEVINGLLGQ